jgi:hypothetical protein
VPKKYVDQNSVKSALTYEIASAYGEGHTRLLYLWKESQHHLLLPRNHWDPTRLPCRVIDCRPRTHQTIDFKSRIKLDHRLQLVDGKKVLMPTGETLQQRSLDAMLGAPGGIVQLACGRGKTVIALEKIAQGRVPALVIIDNTNLLHQWMGEVEALLDVPGGVGIFGQGKKEWQKGLVLATYHSIANWADTIPEEARRWFGQIFWEEAHHCPAPMFSKTADMFYGARYGLTATPERSDGLHVLSEGHIGPVLIKDLAPLMQPSFGFVWTGLELNLRDPLVAGKVMDINQEVHLSKLTSYNGQWPERMNQMLRLVHEAHAVGRTVMLLGNSVAEIVNLATCWERPGHPLYTDIPLPTLADIGEQLNPILLQKRDREKLERKIAALNAQITKAAGGPDTATLQASLNLCLQSLKQHEVAVKLDNELAKRQRQYIQQLTKEVKHVGMLTESVPPATRQKFIKERDIIFSIMKYGKEGMNNPRLDTVILSSLFSDSNALQQLIGRPTRPVPGKKQPVLLAVVDNIGPVIGMARKLINHLRSWPTEAGGPYEPVLIGFPDTWRSKNKMQATTNLFGQ